MFINPQSEYYIVSKLNNIFNTAQGKGISLFHCNIRSLTKHLTLLNDVLYSLDSRPDIVAITETRLSFNSISNLDIPNYNFFSCCYSCHGHYSRFVSNLNFHRPHNYGASTFSFIASKIWETIPLEFKKLCYYRFSKHLKLYISA